MTAARFRHASAGAPVMATVASQTKARVMWPGGPTRVWSPARHPKAKMPLDSGGYGGPYVCQGCNRPCAGVRPVKVGLQGARKWVCGSSCRPSSKANS